MQVNINKKSCVRKKCTLLYAILANFYSGKFITSSLSGHQYDVTKHVLGRDMYVALGYHREPAAGQQRLERRADQWYYLPRFPSENQVHTVSLLMILCKGGDSVFFWVWKVIYVPGR